MSIPVRLVVAGLAAVFAGSALAQSPIEGAWQYQSTVTLVPKEQAASRGADVSNIPDGGHLTNTAEASETRQRVYLFGDGYYSFFGIDSSEPRTLRAEVDEGATGGPKVTREQKLREYGPLDVEFGSYSIEGDKITIKPVLDHVPDNMQQDGSHDRTIQFELDGDQLKLIRATGVTITDVFTRME